MVLNHPWIGRTDAEAETPILCPPDAKNWLIGKDSDAGKDWRWEEKGTTEDEMVGFHHWLSGHEFEPAPGVGDGQGSLVCCSPQDHKESDTTQQLNWTEACLPLASSFISQKTSLLFWQFRLTLLFATQRHLSDTCSYCFTDVLVQSFGCYKKDSK